MTVTYGLVPYLGGVEVFTATGIKVQEIELAHPDTLRKDDFKNVTRKTERQESSRLFTHLRCDRVIASGDFVVVIFMGGGNRIASMFRANGSSVATRVDLGRAGNLIGGGDAGFLGVISVDDMENPVLVHVRLHSPVGSGVFTVGSGSKFVDLIADESLRLRWLI